jgi:hypothetical protein
MLVKNGGSSFSTDELHYTACVLHVCLFSSLLGFSLPSSCFFVSLPCLSVPGSCVRTGNCPVALCFRYVHLKTNELSNVASVNTRL